MFGLIIAKKNWKWAVFGKHPVAGDFLKTGDTTPLLKSFSKWMEKGFSRLSADQKHALVFFWKFWAKGPNGELICGTLQSSVDKYGRHYPLLIIGSGKVQGMMKNWDLLPYACEESWKFLEGFPKKTFRNLKDLKRELKKINPPVTNWPFLIKKSEKFRFVKIEDFEKGINSDLMNKMNNIEGLARLNSFSVVIDSGGEKKNLVSLAKLLLLLKNRSKVEPDVVFLGGTKEENKLICLKRTLIVDDFKAISGG